MDLGGVPSRSSFLFVALVATMLPAGVAGQSMTCGSSGNRYVQPSVDTLALFTSIAQGVTFTEHVVGCLHY